MTLKKMGLVMLLFACTACSTQEYSYPVHFETLLNDRSILTFDVKIIMNDEEGLEELKKKVEKVEYGMRIILTQRHPDQVSSPKRIKSVMRKICESQMVHRVESFDVTNMKLKRYVGYSRYEEDNQGGVSRKGLTGQ
ncbi:hypothetical protein DSLASN_14780 [Desulfoluna limicola]|uniref:Lipoprotein n=2 Tax=Desulfoluna limicola TaxID=2810562 RepID=A0ABN6F1R2_9BACT|nr:hypothetical protein DSLASN_14780 [Desulfoluna limicola]